MENIPQTLRFKGSRQNQPTFLPPSLDELIDQRHPVRMLNEVINQIDLSKLLKTYKGGGSSSYHPRMLLKVLIYGYLSNLYSSRKIAAAVTENIHFMWLAGGQRPDHNTINRFRGQRLGPMIKEIFSQVVLLMISGGVLDMKKAYTDGTIMESRAGRYSFVWAKNAQRHKQTILRQLEELWNYSQNVAKQEMSEAAPPDFPKLDPEQVRQTVEQIDEALKSAPLSEQTQKRKKKVTEAKRTWPDRLAKYNRQQETLNGRGSYSKTDPDATFMRMKDDRQGKADPKPAYNIQATTEEQFIVHYSLHQTPADTGTLKEHLEEIRTQYNQLPEQLCADAGYGSQENYQYLEEHGVKAYVKYNWFDKKQKRKSKGRDKNPFLPEHLHYNSEQDCYYCPMGQKMLFKGTEKKTSTAGYEKVIHKYQAANCRGCPLRGVCHKGKGNRVIMVNHTLNRFKAQAYKLLTSEQGLAHHRQRGVDVESVFGMIKYNRGFDRFMSFGLDKVTAEFGLLAIAHNIKKWAKVMGFSPASPLSARYGKKVACLRSSYSNYENIFPQICNYAA